MNLIILMCALSAPTLGQRTLQKTPGSLIQIKGPVYVEPSSLQPLLSSAVFDQQVSQPVAVGPSPYTPYAPQRTMKMYDEQQDEIAEPMSAQRQSLQAKLYGDAASLQANKPQLKYIPINYVASKNTARKNQRQNIGTRQDLSNKLSDALATSYLNDIPADDMQHISQVPYLRRAKDYSGFQASLGDENLWSRELFDDLRVDRNWKENLPMRRRYNDTRRNDLFNRFISSRG